VGRSARAGARRAFSARLGAALLTGTCLIAAGCGGGSRQDAHEPSGTYRMRIVRASFPALQSIARPTSLVITVQNLGPRTVPNVAVTIDSFYYTEHYPELASNKRPVWIVDQGPGAIASPPVESEAVSPPGGGQTAYVNTWALGPLAPSQLRTFRWRVVPVKPGLHTVRFSIAAGLAGRAKATVVSNGRVVILGSSAPGVPHGLFVVHIAPTPPPRHVNPNTGQVVPGPFPVAP